MADPWPADMTGVGTGAGQIQLVGSYFCLSIMVW
jgi:hypothetical protein